MKLIYVEPYVSSYGDYDEQPDANANITVYENISDLLKIPEFRKELIAAGWQPLEEIKEIHDKTVLKDKYYIKPNYLGYVNEIDITNITNNEVKQLTHNGCIVREVDLKSVLTEEQFKVVADAMKKRQNMEKARAKAAKTKAENAAQRKLDKAKKLLEEHEKKVAELQKKVK